MTDIDRKCAHTGCDAMTNWREGYQALDGSTCCTDEHRKAHNEELWQEEERENGKDV